MNRGVAAILYVCAFGCGGEYGSWNPHDSPGSIGVTAVWSFGPDDVWAGSNIMLHNDGSGFTAVETPPLGQVADFWGFAPNDLYAVAGDLLHWDGASWTTVDTTGLSSFGFTAIWGTSGDDLWVGDDLNGQVHHWNGTGWTSNATQVTSVKDLWGSSSTDIWAGGIFGLSHWDGVSWTQDDDVDSASGLWGLSATDVWAVDDFGVMAHWDGGGWTDTIPVDDDEFEDDATRVWAAATDDVWAVGDGGLISHWDGERWSQEQVGDFPYYPFLNAVHGSSAEDVWIVGLSSDGDNTGVILSR